MSVQALTLAFAARGLAPSEKLVLIALADGRGIDGVADFCGLGIHEAADIIAALVGQGVWPFPEEEARPRLGPLSEALRKSIIAASPACVSCGATEKLCVDHIMPTYHGGTNDRDNLQVLCAPCNTSKGRKLPGEWKGRKT